MLHRVRNYEDMHLLLMNKGKMNNGEIDNILNLLEYMKIQKLK